MDKPECIHLTADMALACLTCNPFPYTHHGPPIHGGKMTDYLISEANMVRAGILPDPTQKEANDA